MDRYLRGEKSRLPRKLGKYLNVRQLGALETFAPFGWSLAFVRRPAFQTPTVVMVNESGNKYAVLLEDGSLDQNAEITIRVDAAPAVSLKTARKGSKRLGTPVIAHRRSRPSWDARIIPHAKAG